MSGVLHPAFLWGLLGLSVPIAIHLLSRKEGKVIKVGSLRHLRSSESPTFKSIKINEILLLAVRCLLLMVMVLFISELLFSTGWKNEKEKWVLVDPVIDVDVALGNVLDSLVSDGYEVRSLEKDFPEIEEAKKEESDYWSLVTELGKKTDTEVLVLSGNRFKKFSGKRLSLPENVKWVTMPVMDQELLVQAVKTSDQEVQIRKAVSNAERTILEFSKRSFSPGERYVIDGGDSIVIENPDTIHIAMMADEQYEYDLKIIQASLEAIDKSTPVVLDIQKTNPDAKTDWVIWFSEREVPAGVKSIILREEKVAPFFDRVSQSQWQISKRLTQEVASQNQLTTELFDLLVPGKENEVVTKHDKRAFPDAVLWSYENEATAVKQAAASTHQEVLFIVLMILFLVERSMAFVKKL